MTKNRSIADEAIYLINQTRRRSGKKIYAILSLKFIIDSIAFVLSLIVSMFCIFDANNIETVRVAFFLLGYLGFNMIHTFYVLNQNSEYRVLKFHFEEEEKEETH
jgi:hypothetical protein